MAKLALINKQKRREKLVAQYASKRDAIKAKMSVNATPDERMDAMKKLGKLPRNANPTRLRNRCSFTAIPPFQPHVRSMPSAGSYNGVRR